MLALMLLVLAPQSHASDFPALPALPDAREALAADIARIAGEVPQGALPPAERGAPETPVFILPEPPDIVVRIDVPLAAHAAGLQPEISTAATGQRVAIGAEAPAEPKAPLVLDIPAPPAIVASIDVPAAVPGSTLVIDEPRIRAFLEARRARLRLSAATIESFVAAYQQRDHAPFWLTADGNASPKSAALAQLIAGAERDGLDAARLGSVMPTLSTGPLGADGQIDIDLGLSLAAWLYAHDARGGRLEPSRISAMLTPNLSLPQPAEVLDKVATAEADRLAAVLEAYNPPHAGYRALRAELARLRAADQTAEEHTGALASAPGRAGLVIKPGWLDGRPLIAGREDVRAPMLRQRLGLPDDASLVVDSELIGALREFQRANELQPSGKLTPKTRAALENPGAPLTRNAAPDRRTMIALVLANMERWRWLPPALGETHIFVNVPDYRLDMVSDGQIVHQARVIVGKPETQTPIFSDEMEFLVVNPSWTVPPSIMKNEFLPRLAVDPDYAARKGYEVIRRGNQISVRQPPGEANALGHIKFMFPNSHAVYLHDTPGRHLFASEARAFSHGCVRVDKPFELAEQLLLRRQGIGQKQLRGMVGYGERTIRLGAKVPVHLAYFTLFVDEAGQLQRRADLYGHDARLRKALAL